MAKEGVAMTTKTQLMTADELLAMPDDGYRYELIQGELSRTMSAGFAHGAYAVNIASEMRAYASPRNLGTAATDPTCLLATNPDHARIPDAAFVRQERMLPLDEMSGALMGAPDIAVEVISPNDRLTQVAAKAAEWLGYGARMVIVVNPRNRTVQVHTPDGVISLTEGDTLDGGDVLPGWSMPVADIFE